MTQQVTANSALMAHMIIKCVDGSVAENTRRHARPSKIILGDHSISEAFEKQLIGLRVGDKKSFRLETEDAFGAPLEGNIMQFPKSQFAQMDSDDLELEVGGIIEFDSANGEVLIGVIKNLTNALVTVDFNHPLAGQALDFEVEVLSIED